MAEALARTIAPAGVEIYSAGSAPTKVNPYAVRAMAELGIDISTHRSKAIADVPRERIGTVFTLCAEEVCPVFPGDVVLHHWPFEDPAAATGSDEEILASFRRVRDQIASRLRAYFSSEIR
jgi:arsenate reductase (thioredoxin)